MSALSKQPHSPRGKHPPVWRVVPLVLAGVVVLAMGIYFGAEAVLATGGSASPVDVNDVIKPTVTALT